MAVQQGRSEVHGAINNERHVCGRRRVGEPAVSSGRGVPLRYVEGLNEARTQVAGVFSIMPQLQQRCL